MVAKNIGIHSESGSWKCGKVRAFPTFPQTFFLLFLNRIPKKITIRRGEGGASASHLPVEPLFKRLLFRNFLTLRIKNLGGYNEKKNIKQQISSEEGDDSISQST